MLRTGSHSIPGVDPAVATPELHLPAFAPPVGQPDCGFVAVGLELIGGGSDVTDTIEEIEPVLVKRVPAAEPLRFSNAHAIDTPPGKRTPKAI